LKPSVKWLSWRHWSRKKGSGVLSGLLGGLTDEQLSSPVSSGVLSESLVDSALQQHLVKLEEEFAGKSVLTLYHAALIVLIRREADVERHFAAFEELWRSHQPQLLSELNLRWLVSAADTFIDHNDDLAVRALLLNTVMLVNTVKLYETEKSQLQGRGLSALLEEPNFNLFDGLTSFKVGADDTLLNQSQRFNMLVKKIQYGALASEIWGRIHAENSSVYARALSLHHKKRTEWI